MPDPDQRNAAYAPCVSMIVFRDILNGVLFFSSFREILPTGSLLVFALLLLKIVVENAHFRSLLSATATDVRSIGAAVSGATQHCSCLATEAPFVQAASSTSGK